MTGKDILDQAANIIKRQDLDRGLLLFFLNTARRYVLRGKAIRRFNTLLKDVTAVNGVIDMNAYRIKSVKTVEWEVNATGETIRKTLVPVISYRIAMENFGSLTRLGEPHAYLEMGSSIHILPVPDSDGKINISGEVWPADLTDSILSTDITAVEIPDALTCLCSAEYYDFLAEADKAAYWRQKGMALVDEYILQLNKADFDRIDVWKRKPFGRPAPARTQKYTGLQVDDLDMGEW